MKQAYYQIHFASFGPIYVWERNANNAVIRAKFQRLEEGLSTDVLSVYRKSAINDGVWINCNITDFQEARRVA